MWNTAAVNFCAFVGETLLRRANEKLRKTNKNQTMRINSTNTTVKTLTIYTELQIQYCWSNRCITSMKHKFLNIELLHIFVYTLYDGKETSSDLIYNMAWISSKDHQPNPPSRTSIKCARANNLRKR